MTFNEFTKCREQAAMLHASQAGEPKLSLDAIFIALQVRSAPASESASHAGMPVHVHVHACGAHAEHAK